MDVALVTTFVDFARAHLWVAVSAQMLSTWVLYIIPLVVFIAILKYEKHPFHKVGYIAASVILASLASEFIFKDYFQVLRPFITLGYAPIVFESNFSFPSTHATFAASLVTSWYLSGARSRSVGIGLLVFAVLVCLSRVLLGVHYPSDILGGIFVGALFALVIKKIVQ